MSTISAAGRFFIFGSGLGSTGMPRPSSMTSHAAVGQQGDVDAVGVAGHGLVDGVVDHLVDEVVQARRTGRADVHARALADGLEAFEDGDVLRAVRGFSGLRHERTDLSQRSRPRARSWPLEPVGRRCATARNERVLLLQARTRLSSVYQSGVTLRRSRGPAELVISQVFEGRTRTSIRSTSTVPRTARNPARRSAARGTATPEPTRVVDTHLKGARRARRAAVCDRRSARPRSPASGRTRRRPSPPTAPPRRRTTRSRPEAHRLGSVSAIVGRQRVPRASLALWQACSARRDDVDPDDRAPAQAALDAGPQRRAPPARVERPAAAPRRWSGRPGPSGGAPRGPAGAGRGRARRTRRRAAGSAVRRPHR